MKLTGKNQDYLVGFLFILWILSPFDNMIFSLIILVLIPLIYLVPYWYGKRQLPWRKSAGGEHAQFTPAWLEFFLSMATPRFKVIEQKPGKIVIKVPVDRILYIMEWFGQRKPLNVEVEYSPLKWYECRIIPYQYKTITTTNVSNY